MVLKPLRAGACFRVLLCVRCWEGEAQGFFFHVFFFSLEIQLLPGCGGSDNLVLNVTATRSVEQRADDEKKRC